MLAARSTMTCDARGAMEIIRSFDGALSRGVYYDGPIITVQNCAAACSGRTWLELSTGMVLVVALSPIVPHR
jgi:hypothetical protein